MIELIEVGTRTGPDTTETFGIVRSGDQTLEIYFRFPARYRDFVRAGPEPFLCALLVPAMSLGHPLVSRLPSSVAVLRGFRRAQAALQLMHPDLLSIVPVEAPSQSSSDPGLGTHLGAFFSGGVDSFYTVLSNLEDRRPGNPALTHLVFMRGLETELEREEGVEATAALVREVAAGLGLELIEGETNIRSFFPVEWGAWNGTGLAGTAHALGAGFRVMLIPAGARYWETGSGIGSHPLIDEACGSEWLRVHNDGAHSSRPYKIAGPVGRSDLALRHLRVCTVNRGAVHNCGQCTKCLGTMLALEAAGLLDRAPTFPSTLPSDWERRYRHPTGVLIRDCIAVARERNRPSSLVRALERKLRRIRIRNAVREILEVSWLSRPLPLIRRVRARMIGTSVTRGAPGKNPEHRDSQQNDDGPDARA